MKHLVTVKMPEREIGKADVEFEIKQSGKAFGALYAPKGLVAWFPSSSSCGYRLYRSDFAGLMEKHGEPKAEVRRKTK